MIEKNEGMLLTKNVFGSYKAVEVEALLNKSDETIRQFKAKNSELENKIRFLVKVVEGYKKNEDVLKQTMLNAQKSSDEIIADAQKRADDLLSAAKTTGERLIGEYRERTLQEERRLATAKAEAEQYIQSITDFCKNEAERLKLIGWKDFGLEIRDNASDPDATAPSEPQKDIPEAAEDDENTKSSAIPSLDSISIKDISIGDFVPLSNQDANNAAVARSQSEPWAASPQSTAYEPESAVATLTRSDAEDESSANEPESIPVIPPQPETVKNKAFENSFESAETAQPRTKPAGIWDSPAKKEKTKGSGTQLIFTEGESAGGQIKKSPLVFNEEKLRMQDGAADDETENLNIKGQGTGNTMKEEGKDDQGEEDDDQDINFDLGFFGKKSKK